jgi:hypothetical protein
MAPKQCQEVRYVSQESRPDGVRTRREATLSRQSGGKRAPGAKARVERPVGAGVGLHWPRSPLPCMRVLTVHINSEVAFAFSHLLGFDLMPRLKAIASQKLSRPNLGNADAYPNLQPILTQPINWALIRQHYDEMIKYTTALRLGTAEPESILRRFTRNNVQHPTYRALVELGRAIKTTFLARYLHEASLRREVNEGLNVVENWNSANGFIFYGKSGEIATNRLDDQELSVFSLHLLQACLVYINTLMLQAILAEPAWMGRMTAEDFRALSPLVYTHVNPYGTFELDMDARLPLAA